MKRIIPILLLFFLGAISYGQENSFSSLQVKELNNKIRLNYMSVHMPTDKVSDQLAPTMGLVGVNYNIPLNNWLYTGAGMHAAIVGDQGGLFTLGVNLGVNTKIHKNLYFDANVHFGGGGGYRYLVNGGGIIYPNIGLQYKKKNYSFGVQYGRVNFFTGIINNDNISFFIEIPSVLRIASYKDARKKFIPENASKDGLWKKPAVRSVQQVTFDFLFPFGDTRNDIAVPIDNTLGLLGFEYQRYVSENSFLYVRTDAMYSGLTSGFMDLFLGVGKNFVDTKHLSLFGKFGIGAAGGRIFPEDGLTMYPNVGADIKITKNFGASIHGGYYRSIGGTFEAYTSGFSIKYYGLSGGAIDPFTRKNVKGIETQGWKVGVQNQFYFDVAKFGIPDSDLQLIALKIDYDISKRLYLSGEASFAHKGKSGGYAHGIFSLGIKSNRFLNHKISTFFEIGTGVAGGGRVDAGEGILVRPVAGINYHINNDFTINASGGKMISPFGNVNSSNINIGVSYSFSMLNGKK